jgi:signal transduction histidine kinase
MNLYQQLLNLVTQPPGDLAYHLVLAAASGGALFSAFSVRRRKPFPQGDRTVLGISLLFSLQLAFLIAARVNYSSGTAPSEGQIMLELAGTLLGILVLIWLWLFPEPDRGIDLGFLSAGSLVIFAALLDYYLLTDPSSSILNGMSWSTLFWTFLPLLVLSIGFTGILIRMPNGWLYGAGMLGMLGTGYILALVLPPSNGTYPGAVRLAHLAAYPLLFTLPERFRGLRDSTPPVIQEQREDLSRRRSNIDLPLLETILEFSRALEEDDQYFQTARLASQSLITDVCLIISAPDAEGNADILAGYDLIRMESFQRTTINSNSIPLLSTYIQQGKMLHLPASSTSRDLINLTQIMQLGQSGNLLASPFHPPGRNLPVGIVVMSPYSQRTWTKSDQIYLAELTEIIRETLEAASRAPHHRVKELQAEMQEMSVTLEETERENAYLSQKLSDSHAILEEAQKTINSLRDLKDKYLDLKKEYQLLADKQNQLNKLAFGEDISEQQRNLKIALTEIAELRADLRAQQNQLEKLRSQAGQNDGYSLSQIEALTSFAQRLRLPIHTFLSAAEEQLTESSELISSLEFKLRQNLQNVQGEIDSVLSDVLEGPGFNLGETGEQPGDLNKALEIALRNVKFRLRERNVRAQVNLPDEIPPLQMEHYALLDIFMALISNAVKRTAAGGTVTIRGSTYQEGDQLQFAYLKIADQGEAVPARKLLKIFGKEGGGEPAPEDLPIPEELLYLSAVKERIEDGGGRIWIDSRPEAGLGISLLLPLSDPQGPV